jgi:sulfur-oxidizing protein SoxA
MIRAACILLLIAVAPLSAQERRSGYEDMNPELQQMQDDEFANPGTLWIGEGREMWSEPAGDAQKACADCHGEAAESMKGVAARYPAFDETLAAPVDLAGRMNLCRERHQDAEPLKRGSRALLAMTAFITHQSKGMPIAPPEDPRLEPWRQRGQELFSTRMGQLNLACSTCHDDLAGGRLAAAVIPQGHPTGYPQYRLEWQEMGGLHRRFDNCFFGIRAQPFERGSDAYVALELFLKQRAAGMPMESPAVRP